MKLCICSRTPAVKIWLYNQSIDLTPSLLSCRVRSSALSRACRNRTLYIPGQHSAELPGKLWSSTKWLQCCLPYSFLLSFLKRGYLRFSFCFVKSAENSSLVLTTVQQYKYTLTCLAFFYLSFFSRRIKADIVYSQTNLVGANNIAQLPLGTQRNCCHQCALHSPSSLSSLPKMAAA